MKQGMVLIILICSLAVLTARPSFADSPDAEHFGQDSLVTGVVIDTVFCMEHPDQSYSLVLPMGYDPGKRWPVVFIFEPGARGRLAAGIFSQAANRFGSIIMCSNNSSNSSHAGSLRAAEAMFKDAGQRYSVDTARFFVAGFSGGSRFASNLALENPFIKGVIACGAGMYHNKKTHPVFRDNLYYYGIMGRLDMNLQDMMDTERRLSPQQVEYHIQYIEIDHVWPPPEEITAAVAWLRFKVDSSDHDARDYFLAFQKEEVRTMEEQELYLDAAVRLESVIHEFPGAGLQGQLGRIKGHKIYKKQARQNKRALDQELLLQKSYLDALSQYVITTPIRPDTVFTLQWWNSEIEKLQDWRDSRNIESSRLASRLLYLLEVHFNEEIEEYLKIRQWEKALFLADLWMKITPERLWSQWNVAMVYVRVGETNKALELIELMVQSGNVKYAWLRDAAEFESLKKEPEYQRLMEILREAEIP